jgi:hypothetical protein
MHDLLSLNVEMKMLEFIFLNLSKFSKWSVSWLT